MKYKFCGTHIFRTEHVLFYELDTDNYEQWKPYVPSGVTATNWDVLTVEQQHQTLLAFKYSRGVFEDFYANNPDVTVSHDDSEFEVFKVD